VIAIDGPAASGKSSTAQWVAQTIGVRHVDSGAFYRALTWVALRGGDPPERWTPSGVLSQAGRVTWRLTDRSVLPLVDGAVVDDELRGTEVTRSVSRVAQMPPVREWVNAQVRAAGTETDVVVDGRDIGTAVFPDASLKVFLVADPWERARRRLIQRLGRSPSDLEIAEETEALVHRDAQDATQSAPARDAITIDTTSLTQAEQVERIVALARAARATRG
jgi:cytidylate kinase